MSDMSPGLRSRTMCLLHLLTFLSASPHFGRRKKVEEISASSVRTLCPEESALLPSVDFEDNESSLLGVCEWGSSFEEETQEVDNLSLCPLGTLQNPAFTERIGIKTYTWSDRRLKKHALSLTDTLGLKILDCGRDPRIYFDLLLVGDISDLIVTETNKLADFLMLNRHILQEENKSL